MHSIIREIMQAPEAERLDYALDYLRTLTCDDHEDVVHYQSLGLSLYQAKLVNYLVRRAGKVCTRDQLTALLYPTDADVAESTISVQVSAARNILRIPIHNCRGAGYFISKEDAAKIAPPPREAIDLPRTPRSSVPDRVRMRLPRANEPWTKDDDIELLRMRKQGSEWWVIADELARTERACQDRYRAIRVCYSA